MKHNAFRWIAAVLLAALLAGCGAETAPPASTAAKPAGSKQSAAYMAASSSLRYAASGLSLSSFGRWTEMVV